MLPNKQFLQPGNEGGEIVTGEDAAADVFTMIYHQLLVRIKTSPQQLCHSLYLGEKITGMLLTDILWLQPLQSIGDPLETLDILNLIQGSEKIIL